MTEEPKKEIKKDTAYLGTPGAQPMEDRPMRPQTDVLGPSWQLQFSIGEKQVTMDMADVILIGRAAEGDEKQVGLDLTPFGAYQNGVSRHHAAITRHEGSLYVEDMGSTNGTRINGFQLTARRKYRLRDGDEVEFARIRATIRFIRPGEG